MKFNWKDKNTTVPTSYLTDLVRINRFDRKKSFYKVIRRNKGFLSVCGFIGNEQDVTGLLSEAENLFNNYGPIYCLKYLQSSTIFINEDRKYLKPTWEKIYRLLIQSMRTEYEYSEIKTFFESSEIQKIELTERQIRSLYYGIGKSQFYFNLGEIEIFFKTKACPDDRDRNKRCQPKNCKSEKANSDLYKVIKQYAS